MKQITLLQGKALLIELPEGAHSVEDSHANGFIYKLPDGYVESWYADEDGGLDGNWQIIGVLSEVTDKTLSTVLDSTELNEGIRLYNIHGEPYPNRLTDSALESLESAILAEGWYFENTMEKPVYLNGRYAKEYTDFQSRVLDRSRCLLLGREI